jgi:hypothetical protein
MTMTLIETKTLGSAQSSIEFTSIPQDATDIIALVSLRADVASNETRLRINSDTGSNYSSRRLGGSGSGSGVGSTLTSTYFRSYVNVPSDYTSNTFSNGHFYFTNYTGSAQKSITHDGVTENNSTEALQSIIAGIWTGTSAITSLLFFPSSGNFVSGSTISLYKILKGSSGGVVVS